MRRYKNQDENQILEIYCNCCGKKLKIEKDLIQEGVFPVRMQWGYFLKRMENTIVLMCVKHAMTDGYLLFKFQWKRIYKMSCCSKKKCVL